jgi:chromosome segregation protein
VEEGDLVIEREALAASRTAAESSLAGVQQALDAARAVAGRSGSRPRHRPRSTTRPLPATCAAQEHALAGLAARLRSLEELDAHRAGYSDAARVVLAQANGRVSQLGAVADYLDVERRYERAVEAVLGDRLQHVIVPTHAHAAAGLQLVREHDAGRCGFLVLESGAKPQVPQRPPAPGACGRSPRSPGRQVRMPR